MRVLLVIMVVALYLNACPEPLTFEQDSLGQIPKGWVAGVTGSGSPKWSVEIDSTAPGQNKVLVQSGQGKFPWCVMKDVSLSDGFVEVKFKAISGKEDQAGGLVWRWKDGKNYYVARANALENNVSLYYTKEGKRYTLKYVDAPVPQGKWNTLRVDFSGTRITVKLNGKRYIVFKDNHISGSGAVGVWTKADSHTAFDDFSWGVVTSDQKKGRSN